MSRLNRRLEKKFLKEAVIFLLLSAGFIVIFFVIILPLLINFSLFINNFKPSPEIKKKTALLQPPRLRSLYDATNSANIKLSGTAAEGQTITLWQNEEEKEKKQTLKDGVFDFEVVLKEGENSFYAKAKEGDLESLLSDTVKISYIKNGPKIEISEPQDNVEVKGKGKQTITIKGKAENTNLLTINGRVIVLNQDNSFEITYELRDGDNLLKAEATDIAGNKTTLERTVKFSPN